MTNGWNRVAQRVADEMSIRGLTEAEIYRRANVDKKTLAKLLDGRSIRSDSQRRLAAAFGWRADAWDRIRRGEEPVTATEDHEPQTPEETLAAIRRELTELWERVDRIEPPEAG